MDIVKYEVLLRTIECGSFSRAALEMGYTQSGISHMIKCIEKEVGFPVFIRSKAGISLTPEGESLLPKIRTLLNASSMLQQHIDDINGLGRGTLRIGAFTSITQMILLSIIKEFHSDYPHVHFEILDGTTQELSKLLMENRIDIGFFSHQSNNAQLKYFPIKQDPMLAVLPRNHPLAANTEFDISNFSQAHFIIPTIEGEYDAIRVIKEFGSSVDTVYSTKDTYATITMVEKGMGFSLISELVLKSHPAKVIALPLKIPQYRALGIFTPPTSDLSPVAKRFFAKCKKDIPVILQKLDDKPPTFSDSFAAL